MKAGLEHTACEHALTAGAIMNVIRELSLVAIARGALSVHVVTASAEAEGEEEHGETLISESDIEEAIRSQRGKNG